MIYGIGIDIVKIQRMRDADDKWGEKFFAKFLTDKEIDYCNRKQDPYPSLSVRFAAKEALVKAIGSEINLNMKEVEILNNEKGKPSLIVHGKAKEFFNDNEIKKSFVSLSHEKEFAVASVVLEV